MPIDTPVSPQTSSEEVRRFLDLLFSNANPHAWLVVSWLNAGQQFRSRWFRRTDAPAITAFIVQQAQRFCTYVGLGLRHPDLPGKASGRGTSDEVVSIAGLWMEWDSAAGQHSAQQLPPHDALLPFLQQQPCRFSLLLDSGGGVHSYLLFKEPWVLNTPEEHARAAHLLRRFQYTMRLQAEAHGWHMDNTSDLARVLRPAGTLNHKYDPPRLVNIVHEDPVRYNPSELEDEPWMAELGTMIAPSASRPAARTSTDFVPVPLEPILQGCAWLRHARDDATNLPEKEWHAMLGIVVRCEGGDEIAHAWSAPYQTDRHRYSYRQTEDKLRHAAIPEGAFTCGEIADRAKTMRYCEGCKHWGHIKSPLNLAPSVDPLTGTVLPLNTGSMNGTAPPDTIPVVALINPESMYTDTYNARALVRYFGNVLHYCYPWKSWLVWNEAYWGRDTSGCVIQYAKLTVTRLARLAEGMSKEELTKLFQHIKSSLSTSKLKAMLENAQSEPGIPIQPETLDTHDWLLNVTNGTLDLTTGHLRPHRQDDLITKCLTVSYDAQATCPLWERFLWRIMGGSQTPDTPEMSTSELEARQDADVRARALIDFLQRAIGYSLTGSTREQCIFILHGPTKTGKSTFLAILRALLGPYGQQADMSSFLHKERDEVRNDLADLAGSRLVCALESQEGRRLAESLVKQLTGGADLVKARFLFQEYFTFKPQFKIFLGTNHKPVIRDTDSAIWERIRLVPFIVPIPLPDRDKTLEAQLCAELSGILAWAMRGCLAWQQRGDLGEPDAVTQATKDYQSEMDNVGRFLDDCCDLTVPDIAKVKTTLLGSAYQAWCRANNESALTNTAFITNLEGRGYRRERGHANQYFWHGVGLQDITTDITEGRKSE